MGRTSSPLSAYKNCDPSLCKPYPSPSLLPCSAATPSRSSSLSIPAPTSVACVHVYFSLRALEWVQAPPASSSSASIRARAHDATATQALGPSVLQSEAKLRCSSTSVSASRPTASSRVLLPEPLPRACASLRAVASIARLNIDLGGVFHTASFATASCCCGACARAPAPHRAHLPTDAAKLACRSPARRPPSARQQSYSPPRSSFRPCTVKFASYVPGRSLQSPRRQRHPRPSLGLSSVQKSRRISSTKLLAYVARPRLRQAPCSSSPSLSECLHERVVLVANCAGCFK
jgi:hypothetical protein